MNKIENLTYEIATMSTERLRELAFMLVVDSPMVAEKLEHLLGAAIEDRLRIQTGVVSYDAE